MNRDWNDQELVRLEKLKKLISQNQNPYAIETVSFSHQIKQINAEYGNYDRESIATITDVFSLVGRVMTMRQTFLVLQNDQSKLQIYFNKKQLNPQIIEHLNNFVDVGDVLWVSGNLFVTKMGELTLNVHKFQIIAKSLHPLPEKHHGLKDPEIRLRKRYLDAIINDSVLKTFKLRSQIITIIRNHLNNAGYLEVQTPLLQPILGGAAARPFITHHNTLDQNFYLRIAPELSLKKMVVAGMEKIYEIGSCFRNEGMDATHNPEFTSLEMYTAYEGLNQTIKRCENIFHAIAHTLQISVIQWNNYEIILDQPFQIVMMHDLVEQKTGVNFFNQKVTLEQALALAKKHKIELQNHQKTVGHIFNLLFEELCEGDLIQPTFVCGHHQDVSPLSKSMPENPEFTLRFELFIGTKEFANGFAELTNPIEQLKRFEQQVQEANLGNDEANEVDYSFVDALEYGLVPTGGLGVGIDRLVMLFTKQETIKNVIFFPHLRKEN